MPTRPNSFTVFNKTYAPPRSPDPKDWELRSILDTHVDSGSPAAAVNGASNFGLTRYMLLRFDLRGWKDGLAQITAAALRWAYAESQSATIAPITIGIVKDVNAASWTQGATYNTVDGVTAWVGGAGGFLNPSTEFTWTPTKMPGTVTANKFVQSGEGSFPNQEMYNGVDDTTFNRTAFAAALNTAMAGQGGFVNIYVNCPSTAQTFSQFAAAAPSMIESRPKLVIISANVNEGLRYISGSINWPPFSDIVNQHPLAKTLFSTYYDHCVVDSSNVTRNGHKCPLTNKSRWSFNGSTLYHLIHFDLSPFLGKTFASVNLRLTVSGAGTNVSVAQAAQTWSVGDGENSSGVPGTTGPTYTLQEKNGSIAWPGAINVASAAFIDTVGQAETTVAASSGGSDIIPVTFDITAMANRALTTYSGQLRLRIRGTGAYVGIMGAAEYIKVTAAGSVASGLINMGHAGRVGSPNISGSYLDSPHLQIVTTDPVP